MAMLAGTFHKRDHFMLQWQQLELLLTTQKQHKSLKVED